MPVLPVADLDDEFGAAHAERRGRRAETHRFRMGLRQLAVDDRERAAPDGCIERAVVGGGIEGELVELEYRTGALGKQRIVAQRDADGRRGARYDAVAFEHLAA